MSKDALAVIKPRKLKRILITPSLILDLIQVGEHGTVVDGKRIEYVENPIPEGAKVAWVRIDHGAVVLVIEDESFPEIQEGDEIPQLTPLYSSVEI